MKFNSNVHVLSYGVNNAAFSAKPTIRSSVASRPKIGYIGGVHKQIDFSLLEKSVSLRKDWDWVFVGPIQERLRALKNFAKRDVFRFKTAPPNLQNILMNLTFARSHI